MATPLDSTDPSDIASAARCFSSCIPDQLSVRSYLLSQVGQIVGPPCVTPSAPTRLVLTHGSPLNPNPGSTTITIGWTEKNSGSFVTGYEVFWGTVSGGPYPFNSGIIPATPKNYTATGLNSGTTYFFVVQAIAFAGCVSPNSAEFSATTTGAVPNGLLNSLVHFYQFQEAAATFADSGSDPIALNYTNAGAGFSRVAGHVQAFAGNYADGAGGPDNVGTVAVAPFDFTGDGTGNISMTWALWMRLNGASGGQPATFTLMSVHTPVYFFAWLNTNFLEFSMQTSGGVQTNLQSAFVYDNNWHLMVGGFDQPNGVIFFSLDNGAKITAPVAQVKSVNSQVYAIGNCGACGGNNGNWSFSDCGTWLNRALTASDISKLWNGGAGLPFSQFTT